MKIAILFGGMSEEVEVSISSGTSIIEVLDKNKYEIYPIYISKDGKFYKYTKDINEIKRLEVGMYPKELENISNIIDYLDKIDLVFPVLHGTFGEDGSIQGFLKMINKPYVGCDILSSSLCMDKIVTKILLSSLGIKMAKGIYLRKSKDKYIVYDNINNEVSYNILELSLYIKEYLHYPVYVKPANAGSSIGVSKVENEYSLEESLNEALKYDKNILIEEEIVGKELECAVIGNDEVYTSTIGEVLSDDVFYSYNSKYNSKVSKTKIPASISDEDIRKIQNIAKKAYKICHCSNLARIDFFLKDNPKEIILNEINTMPGFTNISMYPKLMYDFGYSPRSLLDKLIELALEKD